MVPRSYSYASPRTAAAAALNEKDAVVTPVARVSSKGQSKRKKDQLNQPQISSGLSPSPSLPSKPVVIPTRSQNDGRRRSRQKEEVPAQSRSILPGSSERSQLSPTTSNLLAVTAIPERRRDGTSMKRRVSSEDRHKAMLRSVHARNPRQAMSSGSPRTWEYLLSPPDPEDVESESLDSNTTMIGRLSSPRSISTESMPSLEADEESLCSTDNPETPSLVASNRSGRKSLSTSKGEECALDHPLLPYAAQPIDSIPEESSIDIDISSIRNSPPRSRPSFKSNLTASFRAVRSAARSFSNFATPPPSLYRENLLSESLLSLTLPYAVERRPPPSTDLPDPALRRYLNPIALSPSELHYHSEPLMSPTTDTTPMSASPPTEPAPSSAIQLQSYQRGLQASPHATAPPIFLPHIQSSQNRKSQYNFRRKGLDKDSLNTEDSFTSAPPSLTLQASARQREPRENSDFLRVIVLEMNMRKRGKLGTGDPGRARLWLPARQMESKTTLNSADRGQGQGQEPRSLEKRPQKSSLESKAVIRDDAVKRRTRSSSGILEERAIVPKNKIRSVPIRWQSITL